MAIKHILFDVADTLLYKPALLPTIRRQLQQHGIRATKLQIVRAHRATRELLVVPDKTSRDYYLEFNQRFLEVLGVLPSESLAEAIFLACKNLPWAPFADTRALAGLKVPVGIVSNWDRSLCLKLQSHFPAIAFDPLLVSQELAVAKPDFRIYQECLRRIGKPADEVLYVGDSIHLDMRPALQVGMRAVLLDRAGLCALYQGEKIASLEELPRFLDTGKVP